MKKYAVDETDSEGQKTAAVHTNCPKCGKLLIKEGHLRFCPDHGSEPFEKYDPR
jgi:predicted RNA-binding Zn-ribbon protein involved in translation (DUF1610 family)